RLMPSNMALEPEPLAKPPPCSQNMTGRFPPSPRPRDQTFRTRQSSLVGPTPPAPGFAMLAFDEARGAGVARPSPCGALGPYETAARMAVRAGGLPGAMKRFLPAVDAPYGMPLKTFTPS